MDLRSRQKTGRASLRRLLERKEKRNIHLANTETDVRKCRQVFHGTATRDISAIWLIEPILARDSGSTAMIWHGLSIVLDHLGGNDGMA